MSGRDPARVLVVCHANLCRSPIIERLARYALAKRIGDPVSDGQVPAWEVTSAGTHATPGREMHPYADEVLRERGADATDFVSRHLTAELVAGADLILTAARPQRAACVTLVPAAVPRTFTLREFAHLTAAFPAGLLPTDGARERLLAVREGIRLLRNTIPVLPAAAHDLADPVLGPIEAFVACADEVSATLDSILDLTVPA